MELCDYCLEPDFLIEVIIDNEVHELCINCYMDEKGETT